jgi:hypothetical protein
MPSCHDLHQLHQLLFVGLDKHTYLPKVLDIGLYKNVSLEFLSNFEKQWEDSVIMLHALRETWNKKHEQSILNMATLFKAKE